MSATKDRIGTNPYFYVQPEITSYDIDTNEEFDFARVIASQKFF